MSGLLRFVVIANTRYPPNNTGRVKQGAARGWPAKNKEWGKTAERHKGGNGVVSAVAACFMGGALRAQDLVPLLRSQEIRVWGKLVLDIETAKSVLAAE